MNYKFLVVIVLITITGIGTYFFQNNKVVSEVDLNKTNELIRNNLTVVYNNEGFTPKEIRIKKGETVNFINLSDRKMWVASNNHPEHNIYPEFDQKDISVRDGNYEFKFEKTGSWGYHNHLHSSHEGSVIVE